MPRHSCADCGHEFDGIPAGDQACPECGSEKRWCEPELRGVGFVGDPHLLAAGVHPPVTGCRRSSRSSSSESITTEDEWRLRPVRAAA